MSFTRTNSTEELRKLYCIADCYINLTYEYNYPTTNLEAISCSTPVVTYNTGGSGESADLYGIAIEGEHKLRPAINHICSLDYRNPTLVKSLRKRIGKEEFLVGYNNLYNSKQGRTT